MVVAIVDPLLSIWNAFIAALPGVIGAIVVLIVGYIIAWVLGLVTRKILVAAKLDEWLTKMKVGRGLQLSGILGKVVKWWVLIAFFASAVALLEIGVLSDLLTRLAAWLPNAIVAVLILLFGWLVAEWTADRVAHEKIKGAKLLADVTKVVIVVFVALVGLSQLGIKVSVAETSWLIVLAGIMLAVAIAAGIGFGRAIERHAEDIAKTIRKRI